MWVANGEAMQNSGWSKLQWRNRRGGGTSVFFVEKIAKFRELNSTFRRLGGKRIKFARGDVGVTISFRFRLVMPRGKTLRHFSILGRNGECGAAFAPFFHRRVTRRWEHAASQPVIAARSLVIWSRKKARAFRRKVPRPAASPPHRRGTADSRLFTAKYSPEDMITGWDFQKLKINQQLGRAHDRSLESVRHEPHAAEDARPTLTDVTV